MNFSSILDNYIKLHLVFFWYENNLNELPSVIMQVNVPIKIFLELAKKIIVASTVFMNFNKM